jgi:membrane associated rhomboid family serine protease
MIDVPDDTDRCPVCQVTVLDPADPANADAIAEARQLHTQLGIKGWMYGLLAVAALGAPIITMSLTKNPSAPNLAIVGVLLAGGLLVALKGRRDIAWHVPEAGDVPGRVFRYWTSATVIAGAICLGFGVLSWRVGIEQLAYARGAAPWRIVTAAFTHGGAVHLIGNMLALLTFGMTIDLRVGRAYTSIILAAAAIAGALAQAQSSAEPMVGFSAAIYGLLGATLALMPTRRQILHMQGVPIPLPTWAWLMIIMPLFTFIAWVDQRQHVAWVAHLGGFVAGFLVALPMRKLAPTPWFELAEQKRRRALDRIAS